MLASIGRAGAVEAPPKELRIGYQKIGALLIVKAQRVLELMFRKLHRQSSTACDRSRTSARAFPQVSAGRERWRPHCALRT